MADKARDLQFRVLSDLSRLDLDKAAREFDQLGDDGKRALGKLDDGVETATRRVRDYADDSRDAARRIKGAFDDISDASRKSSKDIDKDVDRAGDSLKEFKDEAHSSGREAAASFGGGFDDITSFVQETAANAFGGFGPIGAAAGIAAAAGIGIITKVFSDSKDRAEEAKATIGEWVQAFVDGQGRIQEAAIQTKLNDLFGDPDRYKKIAQDATDAGISVALYARALSGDAAAAKEVSDRVSTLSDKLDANHHRTTEGEAATLRQANALKSMSGELGIAHGVMSDAERAWRDLDAATRAGITTSVNVDAPTHAELADEYANIKRGVGREVLVPVKIDGARAAQIARLDAQRYFEKHPVTIPTRQGKRPIRDVP